MAGAALSLRHPLPVFTSVIISSPDKHGFLSLCEHVPSVSFLLIFLFCFFMMYLRVIPLSSLAIKGNGLFVGC